MLKSSRPLVLLLIVCLLSSAVGVSCWRQNDASAGVGEISDFTEPRQSRDRIATKSVTNGIGMKLNFVPAGEFMMGNSLDVSDEIALLKKYGNDYPARVFREEYPSHLVRITQPFRMGAHPVTRAQFQQFVEETGYKTDAERDDERGAVGIDVNDGVLWKSHRDASWRNVQFEQTANHTRIPIEQKESIRWLENL